MNEPTNLPPMGPDAKKEVETPKTKPPKPNCRHCYGRGYEGTIPIKDDAVIKVPCRCTIIRDPKERSKTAVRASVSAIGRSAFENHGVE